jgi:ribosomal protein L7Ae-like RNA K-turn-binding protein
LRVESKSDAVPGIIGLAARAGALIQGTERVREAVRGGKVKFVVVAADASDNAKDKLVPLLEASGVPFVEGHDRTSLGMAIGKAPVSAVGVTDREFASRIRAVVGVTSTSRA